MMTFTSGTSSPSRLLLDAVSGGDQQLNVIPVGAPPLLEIYLLPDTPHIPHPVIIPPVLQGDPDL